MRQILIAIALTIGISMAACEQQGPGEELGERVDEAAEEVSDAAEDARNSIEDACEDATGENC